MTDSGKAYETIANKDPEPEDSYLQTNFRHDWSIKTGQAAAHNLISVAKALKANPIPPQKQYTLRQ